MALILSGTDGLSDVDGTAATPAIRGTDTNTGIFFPAADTIAFAEGGVESMRIDANGRVAIGTTTTTPAKLYVLGSGNSNSIMTNTAASFNGGGNALTIGDDGTDVFIGPGNSGSKLSLLSRAGGVYSKALTIDADGNSLVGQTATINSERLCVRQSSSANTTGIAVGYGTGAGQFRSMSIISTNAMTFNNGSNEATLSSAGSWVNASDARLKNNIVDIQYGLNAVVATQPRSYKMNDLEGDYIGFVAQELQTVIPEVVYGDPEKQLGVDYGSLVAVAFKAIQELKATVDAQAARIAALENPPVESVTNE